MNPLLASMRGKTVHPRFPRPGVWALGIGLPMGSHRQIELLFNQADFQVLSDSLICSGEYLSMYTARAQRLLQRLEGCLLDGIEFSDGVLDLLIGRYQVNARPNGSEVGVETIEIVDWPSDRIYQITESSLIVSSVSRIM